MGKLSNIASVGPSGQSGVEDRGTKGTYHIHVLCDLICQKELSENSREFAPLAYLHHSP